MKRSLIAIGVLICMGHGIMAAEIDSGVVHHYKFLGVAYGYQHDIADTGIDAHGALGVASIEEQDFVLTGGGGYFWGTDDDPFDLTFWSVNATFGYVLRLAENHINIIPNVGGAYSEVELEDPTGASITEEEWSISPGIGLSYAINNRLAIHGSYSWVYGFETEEDDHVFSGGATFALFEHVGLTASAHFSAEFGFTGATAGVEFHF